MDSISKAVIPFLFFTATVALSFGVARKRSSVIPDELKYTNYDKELNLAVELALEAGQNILDAIEKEKGVVNKGQVDFVTETDQKNERIIFEGLQKAFPDHQFIGEESVAESHTLPPLTDYPTWIVDPVDGTTNFVHTMPYACVSIGLVVNKIPTVGVVYSPVHNELYMAVRGYGAYMNKHKLQVSSATSIKQSLLLTEIGYDRNEKNLQTLVHCIHAVVLRGAHGMRMIGSGVLSICQVACGRIDAVYVGVANEGWKPWDYAAGILFVTEAGGSVTNLQGGPFDIYGTELIASATPSLQKEITEVLNSVLNPPK